MRRSVVIPASAGRWPRSRRGWSRGLLCGCRCASCRHGRGHLVDEVSATGANTVHAHKLFERRDRLGPLNAFSALPPNGRFFSSIRRDTMVRLNTYDVAAPPPGSPAHPDSHCAVSSSPPACSTGLRIAAHVPAHHAARRGALPVGACPPAPLCRSAAQLCHFRAPIELRLWNLGLHGCRGPAPGRPLQEAQGRARSTPRARGRAASIPGSPPGSVGSACGSSDTYRGSCGCAWLGSAPLPVSQPFKP